MRLVLASRSPRRADLLTSAGYDFEVAPAVAREIVQREDTDRDFYLGPIEAKEYGLIDEVITRKEVKLKDAKR